MKKLLLFVVLFVSIFALSACGEGEKTELNVVFVPSRDAVDILEVTAPLAAQLKAQLSAQGFDFEEINITVSANYAAAAEAARAGTADVVFLPAARDSLNKTTRVAADWNDGLPTEEIDGSNDAATYRSIIIAGQSTKGRELAAKVNAGTDLTWADLEDAAFCTGGSTSSASYIYPNLWLKEEFSKSIADMPNAVDAGGYGFSVAKIEAETCDIAALYGDARMHNAFTEGDIFALTDVIYVSDWIANDGIQVGSHINVKLAEALQIATS